MKKKSLSQTLQKRLDKLQHTIGYSFRKPDYLLVALRHSSFAHELGKEVQSNETLEFLGDAVLGFVVSDYLYRTFSDYCEGKMTLLKSLVVNQKALCKIAKTLKLGPLIFVGKGQKKLRGLDSVLSNTVEAVIGAVFMDGGIRKTRRVILGLLKDLIATTVERGGYGPKNVLQIFCQKTRKGIPVYKTVSTKGPAHKKEFEMAVFLKGKEIARGKGFRKKDAEHAAAKKALRSYRVPQKYPFLVRALS